MTEFGDVLCYECACWFYSEDMPGVVKHGPEEAIEGWLRQHTVLLEEGECDFCGAVLPERRELVRVQRN